MSGSRAGEAARAGALRTCSSYAMSANPLFANKKRNNSILYGLGPAHVTSSPSIHRGAPGRDHDGGRYPPPKRCRTADAAGAKATEDPFGDHEDFTADDLEEIDILASQAFTQDGGAGSSPKSHVLSKAPPGNGSPYAGNAVVQDLDLRVQGNSGRRDLAETHPDRDTFGLEVLQAQHEDLQQKLKALQGEVLVKNGEIRVLRDMLRQTETDAEQQKISHVTLEKERAQVQNEKEKELFKKVQSLQSELQFKDAEMNELRSKLQNHERTNRLVVPSISPKKNSPTAVKAELCTSPQPGRNLFPTKESFNADTTPKTSTAQQAPRIPASKGESETQPPTAGTLQTFSSSYSSQRQNGQGSVLLNALLSQPIRPGNLSLCQLLSSGPETFPGSPTHSNSMSNTTGSSTCSVLPPPRSSALRDAQKLAITGLNAIAMGEDPAEKREVQSRSGLFHLNKLGRLPGAVHLLPLVEHHITAYCQALRTFEKSGAGLSENQSLSSSSTGRSVASSTEDSLSSIVDPALASLGILHHLVFYSLDTVSVLLQSATSAGPPAAPTSEAGQESRTLRPPETVVEEPSPHSLFKKLVQPLCSLSVTCHRDVVRNETLRVLVKLAENSPYELLTSFQSLFTRPALLRCLLPESPLSVAHMTVRLLAVLTDHQKLADLLCSRSESCVLLALYAYVTSRPDKSASQPRWLQLEHEVVRFLTKLSVQGPSSNSDLSGEKCQCNREVVKTLVIMLHQEWLGVRRSAHSPRTAHRRVVQFLRDTVLLLHGLSQKDKHFSEHCLEVLHQYDQAMPGVRAVFRKFNVLKESEEFALDELCPPEVEMADEDLDCA